ncbi:MAG: hypothetical protein C4346_09645, partial [Chloroflexota bacterium]
GVLTLVILLSLWLTGIPASAGKGWCRSDPIVRVSGEDLQIWVAIPIDALPDVIGPIMIELIVPRGTINELVYVDEGFNGFGEAFQWVQGDHDVATDGSLTVTARVSLPIRNGRYVPMQVELIPENGVPSAVYAQTVGVEIDVTLQASSITQTTVRGAAVTGVSATGSGGQAARGGDAIGGSATGADAVPADWVSTKPTETPADPASPEPTTETPQPTPNVAIEATPVVSPEATAAPEEETETSPRDEQPEEPAPATPDPVTPTTELSSLDLVVDSTATPDDERGITDASQPGQAEPDAAEIQEDEPANGTPVEEVAAEPTATEAG